MGLFDSLIGRTAEQVALDRMEELKKYVRISYERKIEDIKLKIEDLKKQRLKLLDAYNEDSTIITKNFDMKGYVLKDIALGVDIMNEETVLEIAEKHYTELF